MSDYIITYTYDKLNRVIRKGRSDGATVEFEYDKQGKLIHKRIRKPDVGQDVHITINLDEKASRRAIEDLVIEFVGPLP